MMNKQATIILFLVLDYYYASLAYIDRPNVRGFKEDEIKKRQ